MDPVVRRPTLVVGVGPFGRNVLDRLDEDAGALEPQDQARFVTVRLPTPGENVADGAPWSLDTFRDDLIRQLDTLLRAGTESTQQLDLALLGDLGEIGGSVLVAVARTISAVLARHFAVPFPPKLPPEQRTVWLNVILAAPAITGSDEGRAALQACTDLEKWHSADPGPPSRCLSRIWLAPRQTTGGGLTDEDVQRSIFLFAAAAYLSGLRDSEALRARLSPSRSGRMLATFAVAAADVPVGRLMDYFAWRTALVGLDALAQAADASHPDASAVDDAISPLHVEGWLSRFGDGDQALLLRQRASAGTDRRLHPTTQEAPPGLAESGTAALRRYSYLLEEPQPSSPALPKEDEEPFLKADRAEAFLVDDALKQAQDFVASRLVPERGLRELSLVSEGLGRMAELLERVVNAPRQDPLAQVQTVPSRDAAVAAGALLGAADRKHGTLAVTLAASPLAATLAVAVAAVLAATGSPVIGDPVMKVLGPGLAVGVLVGVAWSLATLFVAQRALHRVVADRISEIGEADAGLTPGGPTRPEEVSLELRRRRMARTLARSLRARQGRIRAVRDALEAARERARAELGGLGVTPGPMVREDDTRKLLPPPTPLHWPLFPPDVIPEICLKTRAVQDDAIWATRLLQAAWPMDGLLTDLPFADVGRWYSLSRSQHDKTVQKQSPFNWPDVGSPIGDQVAAFLATAPRALSFGLKPLRDDGSPEQSANEEELLALAPTDAGSVISSAQRRASGVPQFTEYKSLSAIPRVVVLKTATEFDTAAVWRGM
jgi:hypothetical protein